MSATPAGARAESCGGQDPADRPLPYPVTQPGSARAATVRVMPPTWCLVLDDQVAALQCSSENLSG